MCYQNVQGWGNCSGFPYLGKEKLPQGILPRILGQNCVCWQSQAESHERWEFKVSDLPGGSGQDVTRLTEPICCVSHTAREKRKR